MPTRARIAIALLIAAACWIAPAYAQKATERYVPVGRSPGLSGQQTIVGTIQAVYVDERAMVVVGPRGMREVSVTDSTWIWLDRTELGRTNLTGTLADCRPGRTVEVKFEEAEWGRAAEWIKIRIAETPSP